MDENDYGCDRDFIDSFKTQIEKMLLVAEYCNAPFRFLPLVDFYYRKINQNAILIFVAILFLTPVALLSTSHVSGKIVAKTIVKIKQKFQLSLLTTSLIILPLTSLSTIRLNIRNGQEGDIYINASQIFGTYILHLSSILGFGVYISGADIAVPKLFILKETVFCMVIMLLVLVFSFIGSAEFLSVSLFIFAYFVYLIISIRINQTIALEEIEAQKITGNITDENDDNKLPDLNIKVSDISFEKPEEDLQKIAQETTENKTLINEDLDFDFGEDLDEERDENEEQTDDKKLTIFQAIIKNLTNKEYSVQEKWFKLPLDLLFMFFIPDSENPLMETNYKFLIIGFSVAFPCFTFQLISFSLFKFALISFFVYAIFLLLDKLGLNPKYKELITDICCILSAVAFMNAFGILTSDLLTFFSFYFTSDEVCANGIFLAVNSSLSFFFICHSLCEIGEFKLVILGIFTVSNFELLWSLALTILVRTINWLSDFDLMIVLSKTNLILIGASELADRQFTRNLVVLVVILVLLGAYFLNRNNFVLKHSSSRVLFAVYGLFLFYTLTRNI